MSNNDKEDERIVVLGLFKFISISITVLSAIISIGSAISKARSLEPEYIYTIPVLSGSTPVQSQDIIPTNIEYYYSDGINISPERQNSTDQLIVTAQFLNAGNTPETAQLKLLISGIIAESKIATLIPGEVGSIYTIIPPDISQDINPSAIVTSINTTPGINRGIPHAT